MRVGSEIKYEDYYDKKKIMLSFLTKLFSFLAILSEILIIKVRNYK